METIKLDDDMSIDPFVHLRGGEKIDVEMQDSGVVVLRISGRHCHMPMFFRDAGHLANFIGEVDAVLMRLRGGSGKDADHNDAKLAGCSDAAPTISKNVAVVAWDIAVQAAKMRND
jgi:hypothetical protein